MSIFAAVFMAILGVVLSALVISSVGKLFTPSFDRPDRSAILPTSPRSTAEFSVDMDELIEKHKQG